MPDLFNSFKAAKFLAFVFFAAFVLFAFSCDDFVNVYGQTPPATEPPTEPPTDETPAVSDPKCLSISGSRFEKYYWQLDPDSYNATISLSSPATLGYQHGGEYAFNQISLSNLPLQHFAENSPFTHQVTGTVAVSGRAEGISAAYSMPFKKSALLSPYKDYNKMEPLNVLSTFANTPGDLVLSYTGDYSSANKKEDFRTFSMSFSADFLKSCNDATKFVIPYGPLNADTEFAVDGVYPIDLTASASAYVYLTPVKNQYRSLTATFSQGATVSDIVATSIVKDYEYDPALNTLSVYFNDYDFPYMGDVLFYKIGIKEGTPPASKVIRIEG